MKSKKIILRAKWISLLRVKNLQSGRVYYSISVNPWLIPYTQQTLSDDQIKQHFNPGNNRGPGWCWKFKSKTEAEQLITLAIMKWGT